MNRPTLIVLLLLVCQNAWCDDLWLQAAAAESTVSSQQFGLTRTINGDGPIDGELGLSHFNGSGAGWTLAKLGMSGRVNDAFILGGRLELGPGHSDGDDITYKKAAVTATWLVAPGWSAQISDTYLDIADSNGHVYNTAVTHSFSSGVSLTVERTGSTGGNIDVRQLGFKFRWQRSLPIFGGIYSGETRNPIILNEIGNDFSNDALDLRQAYVGIEIPFGDLSMLAVFDYLRLDQTTRREISLAIRIPLGSRGGDR